jgi:transcriptional regulator with XRE-family HTH domain
MTSQKWTPDSEPLFAAMTVGERVRWLLESKSIKQTELAAKMGTTQAMISNIVTDSSRKPSAPSLLSMSDVFECRPSWILDGRGDPFAWAVVSDARQAELLRLYKALAEPQREALLITARALAK